MSPPFARIAAEQKAAAQHQRVTTTTAVIGEASLHSDRLSQGDGLFMFSFLTPFGRAMSNGIMR
jgi:hypothetical protein